MYIYLIITIILWLEIMGINLCDFCVMTYRYLNLNEKAINVCYRCIYLYSCCEIQYNKIKHEISQHLMQFWKEIPKLKLILIDEYGNKIFGIKSPEIYDKKRLEFLCSEYNYKDMMLIVNNNNGCSDYVFYRDLPESFDYELSNVKLITVALQYESNNYTIDLKNDICNYYIVNNYLNESFFKYYLKTILKINISEDNFDYDVTIVDNNVNIFTLLPHQSIVFDKVDYRIIADATSEENANSDSDKSDDFVKLDEN